MTDKKKKIKALMEPYVSEIITNDYHEPEQGDSFTRLDPVMRDRLRSIYPDKQRREVRVVALKRYRWVAVIVLVIASLLIVKPVRAGLYGLFVTIVESIFSSDGNQAITYVLDMKGAQVQPLQLSDDNYRIDTYLVSNEDGSTLNVGIAYESHDAVESIWSDREGEYFEVDRLQVQTYARAYEDEQGFYARIELETHNLIVTMYGGDRDDFIHILRSIRRDNH